MVVSVVVVVDMSRRDSHDVQLLCDGVISAGQRDRRSDSGGRG